MQCFLKINIRLINAITLKCRARHGQTGAPMSGQDYFGKQDKHVIFIFIRTKPQRLQTLNLHY